jgi:hypothetical protein
MGWFKLVQVLNEDDDGIDVVGEMVIEPFCGNVVARWQCECASLWVRSASGDTHRSVCDLAVGSVMLE